jgi:hypothetical protein
MACSRLVPHFGVAVRLRYPALQRRQPFNAPERVVVLAPEYRDVMAAVRRRRDRGQPMPTNPLPLCDLLRPHRVIPVHYEGWKHLKEGRAAIEREFARSPERLRTAVQWLSIGTSMDLAVEAHVVGLGRKGV